jgi:hypothetical protein
MRAGRKRCTALELAVQRAAVAGLIEAHVVHAPARGAQLGGEGAHRREHEGDLLAVVRHVAGFLRDLGEQHEVARAVCAAQRGEGGAQLVTQHGAQRLYRGVVVHGRGYARCRGSAQGLAYTGQSA